MLITRPGQDSAHRTDRYVPRHRLEREPRLGAHLRRGVVGSIAGVALAGGIALPAHASSLDEPNGPHQDDGDQSNQTSLSKDRLPDLFVGGSVMRIAASKAGTPYAYGATGPGAFDCSGYTQWVYRQMGKNLPRTSAAQAGATRRISAADARPGDLVFFTDAGGVYHVGIYAGGHAIWHAPRPGEGVRREQIWTSSVFYGRP